MRADRRCPGVSTCLPMNNNKHSADNVSRSQPKPVLKIGIDAHALQYVIATQIDGSSAKPAQRFDQTGLMGWIGKKLKEGFAVVTCYEAGPLCYVLHRKLTELGATNCVPASFHLEIKFSFSRILL
jgi:hypothetical protein